MFTLATLIFFVSSLMNVILQTSKTILTIKSTRTIASLMNAIAFAFYTIVLKQISGADMMVSVIVTFTSNLLGVWFSMWFLDKIKKDTLWKISLTCKNFKDVDLIKGYLTALNIGFVDYNNKVLDIFSYDQYESRQIRSILAKFNVKYHVVKNVGGL